MWNIYDKQNYSTAKINTKDVLAPAIMLKQSDQLEIQGFKGKEMTMSKVLPTLNKLSMSLSRIHRFVMSLRSMAI
jgi:hypothetical protein